MVAGTVVSAVIGGVAGLLFADAHDHGLVQTVLAYQIGGTIAVLGHLALRVQSLVRQL